MQLSRLIGADITLEACGSPAADIDIAAITADSRQVGAHALFAALPGVRTDGARFVAEAVAKGAAAVLAGSDASLSVPSGVAVLRAREPRRALAQMAARFYGRQPDHVMAVTGTNGKTSIVEFTRQILAACGRRSASLGTIGIVKPDGAVYGSLTTPDPVSLHRALADLAGDGVTHLALEASSHGLDQFRLEGVRFTAGAFNNIGRDHLDYHPTLEAYLGAKLRLFSEVLPPDATAVVNVDAPGADRALQVIAARGLRLIGTGRRGADLRLASVQRNGFRQLLRVDSGCRSYDIALPLIGDYQAGNALVAAGLALACGEDHDAIMAALAHLQGVPGRLEVVGESRGGIAIVDYAHKPEALAAALDALRPFASGKLVCVLGCGGDRDRGKRPIMGRIATSKADVVIVTDDNPRSERPEQIRAEILAEAPAAREIGDRSEAIRAGVALLGAGDVLLVAGKGHETGQIIGDKVLPFSDRLEVEGAIGEGGRG